MYFKRIEMQGFKSFADPVTIELNDGITCIVGPNGSGKSNISDALRWVLGEQSPKQLRGNKMDEVIFAGTASRRPKGMAEVSLIIDNQTGMLPLEYSEVAVTRRMYRSGESEYLINGNPCRLRDIKELFMDTGIGVDGYSIIGQGKIQEIVSTKPENRREIFEEAAGVVLYKNRKSDAERKLKSAGDNLDRVKDILSEIEGRIGGLKDESEKATEFIGLRDRYRHLEVNIILHNIDGLDRNLRASEEELRALNESFDQNQEELRRLEEVLEGQRLRDAELSEAFEEANRALLARMEELHTIENKGQINSERLGQIEKDLGRLDAELSEIAGKLESQQKNYDELTAGENELVRARDEAERELREAIYRLNDHTGKAAAVREEIERKKNERIDHEHEVVRLRAEIGTLDNYRRTLEERAAQLASEHEEEGDGNAQSLARLEEIRKTYAEKETERERSLARLNEIAESILRTNEEAASISSEIEELIIRGNRLTARKNTIEEMESNYEGYNNAIRLVMQKNFRGVIGTVSELMRVPDGLELAIETALGGSMQNIICRDDASAKMAVEWLKSARAGRATFLPIASVRSSRPKTDPSLESQPGYLGIASERIEYGDEYRQIYEYLLGRVILADDMDHAIRISKRIGSAFRVVTLDGEVISGSGAITGGRYKHKSANLLERRKEIGELETEIERIHARIQSLEKTRNDRSEDLRSLKQDRQELSDALRQFEVELGVLRSDKEHAEALAEAARTRAQRFDDELLTIQDDIGRASDMIDRYQLRIDESEAASRKIEEFVETLMEDQERYSAQVEEDNEAVVRSRIRASEQDAKILGMNELIERVRDTITDLEEDREESEAIYQEYQKQRLLLTSTGADSEEKVAALRTEKSALEEQIATITKESDQNRTEHEHSLKEQKEKSGRMTALQDEKYKLEVKTARNEAILSAQKDKLWEEFEISYAEALEMREEHFAITAGNKEARDIKVRMAELGDVNISAIEEYKAVSLRYEFMSAQEQDINKAMEELRSIIRSMDRTIRGKFKENFDKVVINFEQIFRELFGGGHAELRLENEEDPLESGIEIIAQPPGKALKNINLMSGGEKTLTAIALMFAVLKAKPTPFCILDEVEAALDEANIERFSNYLKNFREIQFALITHQKATMEHADVLYGVTMPEQGISRLLSLKLSDRDDFVLD